MVPCAAYQSVLWLDQPLWFLYNHIFTRSPAAVTIKKLKKKVYYLQDLKLHVPHSEVGGKLGRKRKGESE